MMNTQFALCFILAFFFFFCGGAYGATITFTNKCPYTVWPGSLTSAQKPQLPKTGFELATGKSDSVDVPSPWEGRFWGRTGCSTNSGKFSCATADCGSGQVACNGAGAVPPATLAELHVEANGGKDFYDISNVDGFNVPMSIAPQGGTGDCKPSSCPANINGVCPPELQMKGPDGSVVACKSACLAFNQPQYCCTGEFNSPDKWFHSFLFVNFVLNFFTTMAKKTSATKNNNKRIPPIDRVPKHSQQPRSSPPKRRTDFSFFIRNPSSISNPAIDSSLGSSSGEVRLSNVTASSSLQRRMSVKQFSKDTLVRCNNYQEGRPVCSSEYFDVPVAELDSVDLGGNRDACIKISESTPRESSVSDSSSLAVTPGSVVWARTSCQTWWPAEIMEERCAPSDYVKDGHVLVQFYGNHPSAWIDPSTNISIFEDSFEERSNNPSNDFQDALKQALQRKAQLSSCQNLSPDRSAHSNQQDRSAGKYSSPSSSRTLNDFQERRRGKRERKPKVHFDEVSYPIKSERKDRRLKIMRYLGLAPPVGSPF